MTLIYYQYQKLIIPWWRPIKFLHFPFSSYECNGKPIFILFYVIFVGFVFNFGCTKVSVVFLLATWNIISWKLFCRTKRILTRSNFQWPCYKQYFMHEYDPPPDLWQSRKFFKHGNNSQNESQVVTTNKKNKKIIRKRMENANRIKLPLSITACRKCLNSIIFPIYSMAFSLSLKSFIRCFVLTFQSPWHCCYFPIRLIFL